MKKLLFAGLFACALPFMTGCKQQQVQAVLQPLQTVGCDVESAITSSFGAEVVAECQGTSPVECGQAFQTALGNVNLCQAAVSSPAASGQMKGMAAPHWSKISDITSADLEKAKSGMHAEAVHKMGIVGAVACPIAINTGLGLLTGVIPPACGCKGNLNASQVSAALVAACQAAIPL